MYVFLATPTGSILTVHVYRTVKSTKLDYLVLAYLCFPPNSETVSINLLIKINVDRGGFNVADR